MGEDMAKFRWRALMAGIALYTDLFRHTGVRMFYTRHRGPPDSQECGVTSSIQVGSSSQAAVDWR